MPTQTEKLDPDELAFRAVLKLAGQRKWRQGARPRWPMPLSRLAQAAYLAQHQRPLNLAAREAVQAALTLSAVKVLRQCLLDEASAEVVPALFVVWVLYAAPVFEFTTHVDQADLGVILTRAADVRQTLVAVGLQGDALKRAERHLLQHYPLHRNRVAELERLGLQVWYEAICAASRALEAQHPVLRGLAWPRLTHLHQPRLSHADRIERPALLAKILATLQSPAAPRVTFIVGQAGSGKSTLLEALADDPHMQAQFPDGVLWADLRPGAPAEAWLRVWGQHMGLPMNDSVDIHLYDMRLREALAAWRVLVVIDNAMQADEIALLNIVGEQGAVVVSTQHAALPTQLPTAARITCGPLDNAEARALWQARLGASPPETEFEWLYHYVGGNAMAFDGALALVAQSPTPAARQAHWAYLHEQLGTTRDRPLPPDVARAIFQVLEATRQALPPELRAALDALWQLPPVARYSLTGVQALWHESPTVARHWLHTLAAYRLVTLGEKASSKVEFELHEQTLRYVRHRALQARAHWNETESYRLPWVQAYGASPTGAIEQRVVSWHMARVSIGQRLRALWRRKLGPGRRWGQGDWANLMAGWPLLTLAEWVYLAQQQRALDHAVWGVGVSLGVWLIMWLAVMATTGVDVYPAVYVILAIFMGRLVVIASRWEAMYARMYARVLLAEDEMG